MLIPVPQPRGGVIVVGRTTLTYLSGTGQIQAVELSPTIVTSYCQLDTEGSKKKN